MPVFGKGGVGVGSANYRADRRPRRASPRSAPGRRRRPASDRRGVQASHRAGRTSVWQRSMKYSTGGAARWGGDSTPHVARLIDARRTAVSALCMLATQSTGAIVMVLSVVDFYRSSNGDRWQLIRDTASGRSLVRHEPNLSSGGRVTDRTSKSF
jgi:hypothetical protein